MNETSFSTLTLEGKYFEGNQLIAYANDRLENSLTADWQKAIFDFILQWLNKDDYLNIKTSGSTGVPKTIRIKKQKMVNSAIKTGEYLDLRKGDKSLLALPAGYIAGKMMVVRAMVLGLDLHFVKPLADPLNAIDEDFDFAAMVPLQIYEILSQVGGIEKLNRIKKLIIGGAPLAPSLQTEIRKLSNESYLSYGMTETVSHIAMQKLRGQDADGYMHPLPGVKVWANEEGRLCIEAPKLADGIIKTGDLAEFIDKNRFKILGRCDNLIITGGINVIPELVEKKLETYIKDRFIISSVPDEKLGAKLLLVIEGQPWLVQEQQAIENVLKQKFGKSERLRQLFFLPDFPETPGGKIDRPGIQKMIGEGE